MEIAHNSEDMSVYWRSFTRSLRKLINDHGRECVWDRYRIRRYRYFRVILHRYPLIVSYKFWTFVKTFKFWECICFQDEEEFKMNGILLRTIQGWGLESTSIKTSHKKALSRERLYDESSSRDKGGVWRGKGDRWREFSHLRLKNNISSQISARGSASIEKYLND